MVSFVFNIQTRTFITKFEMKQDLKRGPIILESGRNAKPCPRYMYLKYVFMSLSLGLRFHITPMVKMESRVILVKSCLKDCVEPYKGGLQAFISTLQRLLF